MTTLDQIKGGTSAQVVKINGSPPIRKRLLDMGFTKGAQITIIKRAPLQDPIEIEMKGFHLTLRINEAKVVTVEPVS